MHTTAVIQQPQATMPEAAAGNLFSAAFESTCIAVVGASGGVFGVMGLFIADMIMNFKTITRYPTCIAMLQVCFALVPYCSPPPPRQHTHYLQAAKNHMLPAPMIRQHMSPAPVLLL